MSKRNIKYITKKDIDNYIKNGKTIIIIENIVYDVTKFLDIHPGGGEILIAHNGKDVTKEFIDVMHPDYAIELRKKYKIGELLKKRKYKKNNLIKNNYMFYIFVIILFMAIYYLVK